MNERVPAFAAAGVLLVGGGFLVRWISSARKEPPPRKVMQFTMVNVQPQVQRAPTPPPPVVQPKIQEEPQRTRVDLKPTDFTPPDTQPRAPSGGGGHLALAAEGSGGGDAFNLAGSPGGKGLLSGGGLGDGSGDGEGDGLGSGAGNKFGWYYAQTAVELESALKKEKELGTASARLELRVWVDGSGRISRIEPLRPESEPRVLEALQQTVGLRLRQPPPEGTPMPMILRLTARRPR
jgi:protein TonB